VVRANADWNQFVLDCGGDPTVGAIGTDFLSLCDLALEQGFEGSAEVAMGIRSLLAGRTSRFRMEYRAPTANESWLVVSAAALPPEIGGCVMHQVDITDRKRYEHQLIDAALRDGLTGLPNRALLTDRLNIALERSEHRPEGV